MSRHSKVDRKRVLVGCCCFFALISTVVKSVLLIAFIFCMFCKSGHEMKIKLWAESTLQLEGLGPCERGPKVHRYARNQQRLSLSLTTRTSAMATKFLASKATVAHRMYKIYSRFHSVRRILSLWCRMPRDLDILNSFWECVCVCDWTLRGNQIQKCNLKSLKLVAMFSCCLSDPDVGGVFCVRVMLSPPYRQIKRVRVSIIPFSACRGQHRRHMG